MRSTPCRWRHLGAALVLACGVGGCATPPAEPLWPLEGPTWKLAQLRGQPVGSTLPGREPQLVLQAEGNRVAGSSGCNRFAGGFSREAATLRFGNLAGTRMMCPGGADVEARFLAMLGEVAGWRVVDDRLQLRDSVGDVIAEFTVASQRYVCDGGRVLFVHYDHADPQRAEARLVLDGREYRLRAVPVASGARYVADPGRRAGTSLEWSSKGPEGLLREGSSGSAAESRQTIAQCALR